MATMQEKNPATKHNTIKRACAICIKDISTAVNFHLDGSSPDCTFSMLHRTKCHCITASIFRLCRFSIGKRKEARCGFLEQLRPAFERPIVTKQLLDWQIKKAYVFGAEGARVAVIRVIASMRLHFLHEALVPAPSQCWRRWQPICAIHRAHLHMITVCTF